MWKREGIVLLAVYVAVVMVMIAVLTQPSGILSTVSPPHPAAELKAALDDAWSELHDATPTGWFVGRPVYVERRRSWEQYAYDPSERAKDGHRSREWTATAPSELEVVRELARCLRIIGDGGVPG